MAEFAGFSSCLFPEIPAKMAVSRHNFPASNHVLVYSVTI
jgi:hypothetical protein